MASISQKLKLNEAAEAASGVSATTGLSISRIIGQLGWVGASQISTASSRLAVSILVARLLPPDQFGRFVFFASCTLVVTSLAELNLGRTLLRFLAVSNGQQNANAGNEVAAAVFQAKLVLTAPILAIGVGVALLSALANSLVLWALIAGVLASFGPLMAAVFQLLGKYRSYFLAYSVDFVRLAVVVVLALFGLISLKAVVLVYIVSPMPLAILWPGIGYRWKELLQPASRATYEALWTFGKWIIPIALFDALWQRIDVLMLEAMSGPGSVGIYSGAYMFMGVAALVSTSVTTLVYPRMAEAHGKESAAQVARHYRQSGNVAAYLGMPCVFGIAALAPALIRTLIGEAYLPGLKLLPWFCVYGIFLILQMNTGAVFWAVGKPGLSLCWGLILIVTSVTGNLLLIPGRQAEGAAIVLAASAILAGLFSWGGVALCVGVWPDFRRIGYYLFSAALVYGAVRFIPLPSSGIEDIGIRIAIGVVVYCGAIKVICGSTLAPLVEMAEIC